MDGGERKTYGETKRKRNEDRGEIVEEEEEEENAWHRSDKSEDVEIALRTDGKREREREAAITTSPPHTSIYVQFSIHRSYGVVKNRKGGFIAMEVGYVGNTISRMYVYFGLHISCIKCRVATSPPCWNNNLF